MHHIMNINAVDRYSVVVLMINWSVINHNFKISVTRLRSRDWYV